MSTRHAMDPHELADLDLDAIEARVAAASPGPWVITGDNPCSNGDGPFIAHAREDVPALLAEVRRLRDRSDEAAWLIEYSGTGAAPAYFCGESYVWGDLSQAIRFARSEDAERTARFAGLNLYQVTEHLWLGR